MRARRGNSHRERRLRALGLSAYFRPSFNRIPALLALLAIVIQCFVVQAHIHAPLGAGAFVPAATGSASSDPDDGSANLPRGKFPAGDDPSNCRLCQELVHTFVAPSAALLAVAVVLAPSLLILSHAAPVAAQGGHIWRSRAPPRRSTMS